MVTKLRSQIEAQLRQSRLRLTPQRFAVLEYLANNTTHPAAEEIFSAINRRFPRASKATVYNTVAALEEAGLITTLCFEDGVNRFDANLARHHHFICKHCRKIFDVPGASLRGRLELRGPHKMDGYEVIVRGACQNCR